MPGEPSAWVKGVPLEFEPRCGCGCAYPTDRRESSQSMTPTHARLARELSDLAKHAASAAKGMHARGDANGGYYNDGREAAFVWLAYQLLDPDSHLMRKLREDVKP